jgi:hypothetical protein
MTGYTLQTLSTSLKKSQLEHMRQEQRFGPGELWTRDTHRQQKKSDVPSAQSWRANENRWQDNEVAAGAEQTREQAPWAEELTAARQG